MARTKSEIRAFLNGLVGHTCVDKSDGRLNGQCVCLIKNLLDFLGVPNPYAARGNARDAGDSYIRQGIGTAGKGWLTIVVNRDMGRIYEPSLGRYVNYGHIWVDLMNEANYESNGARALVVTQNTRPISQGQQFINLDQWVKGDDMPIPDADNYYFRYGQKLAMQVRGRQLSRDEFRKHIVGNSDLRAVEILSDDAEADRCQAAQELGFVASRDNWQQQIYNLQDALKGRPTAAQLADAQKIANDLGAKLETANELAEAKVKESQALSEKIAEYQKQEAEDKAAGDTLLRRIGQFFSKYLGGK